MKLFYLKNYKAIHHTITIMMYAVMFSLLGLGPNLLKEFPLQVLLLVVSYFTTKFTLKKSGLDEEVLKELEKYNKQKKSEI